MYTHAMEVHFDAGKQTTGEHFADCRRMKQLKQQIETHHAGSVLHVDDATPSAHAWTIPISFQQPYLLKTIGNQYDCKICKQQLSKANLLVCQPINRCYSNNNK